MKQHIPSAILVLILIVLLFLQRGVNKDVEAQLKANREITTFVVASLVKLQVFTSPDNGQTLQINPAFVQPQ